MTDAHGGWTHDEAKQHTLIERLHERCATYAGMPCEYRVANEADWCERCLAAKALESGGGAREAFVAGWFAHARNPGRVFIEDAWSAYTKTLLSPEVDQQ